MRKARHLRDDLESELGILLRLHKAYVLNLVAVNIAGQFAT